MTNLIDFAWAQIPSPAIKTAGYVGVMRYLGGTARLTPVERDNHLAAGLGIGLVWETAADEADHPERGAQDAINANREADALGFPETCPLFFADDQNDPDTSQELGYFDGVRQHSRRSVGVYSGGNVVKAVMDAGYAQYGWMVETWYPHDGAKPHLIQLANSKAPFITGVSPDTYDSNVLVNSFPLWGVSEPTQPTSTIKTRRMDMIEVNYNSVAYHVWAHNGQVLYRAYKDGGPQGIISVPGKTPYSVDMNTPFPMAVGPFIFFAGTDGKEIMLAPSAYGLIAQVQ